MWERRWLRWLRWLRSAHRGRYGALIGTDQRLGLTNGTGDPSVCAVTVVIPTHGIHREGMLRSCLSSLEACGPSSGRPEVVVVVDGGDPTRPPTQLPGSPLVIVKVHGGPAAARNVGWRATTGALVAFLDDDVEVDADWLRDLERTFSENPDISGVGGRVDPYDPKNPVSRMITDFGHIDHHEGSDGLRLVTANAAFRREAVAAVGGFDERFTTASGEDWDLSACLLAAGFELATTASMGVRHRHPTSLSSLRSTARRYHESVPLLIDTGARPAAADTPVVVAGGRKQLPLPRRIVGIAKAQRKNVIAHLRSLGPSGGRWSSVCDGFELVVYGAPYLRLVPRYVVRARSGRTRPGPLTALVEALLEVLWRAEFGRPVAARRAGTGDADAADITP